MAYKKQYFKNGNVLTAEQLNHMEDGIVDAEKNAQSGGGTGTGLPSDVGPYKQMATDGEGKWVPVDRLAWKETEKNVLWEGDFTTTATEWDNGETVYGSQMIPVDKYGLFFDRNVWYDFEGTSYPLPENGSYYGNFHLLDSSVADDGTPVAVYFYTTGNITQLIFYTREPGDYHIKLYDKAETTHPIPAEYLPAGPILVVDMTVTVGDAGAVFSLEKTYEELLAVLATGVLIFVRMVPTTSGTAPFFYQYNASGTNHLSFSRYLTNDGNFKEEEVRVNDDNTVTITTTNIVALS